MTMKLVVLMMAISMTGAAEDEMAVHLPRLEAPFSLDGDLGDWDGALPLRLGGKSHLPLASVWPGPAPQPWENDASASLWFAWTADGLVMAGEVVNHGPDKSDISLSVAAGPDKLDVNFQDGATATLPGVLTNSKPTVHGYRFEALVPWSLLPRFKPTPGKALTMAAAVNAQGNLLRRNASQDLSCLTVRPIRFVLAAEQGGDWSPFCHFTASCGDASFAFRVECGDAMASLAKTARLAIKRQDGGSLAERSVPLDEFSRAGRLLASPELSLPSGTLPDDGCVVEAVFLDTAGTPIGQAKFCGAALPLVARRALAAASTKLLAAKLPELARRAPFQASAWFGVVSSVEWVRRSLALNQSYDNSELLSRAVAELRCRLATLEGRTLNERRGLMSLLRLAADPEAQVVVEFERSRSTPERRKGSVMVNWGGVPLMAAQVEEFDSEAEAKRGAGKPGFALLPYWNLQPGWDSYDPLAECLFLHSNLQAGAAPFAALDALDIKAVAFFASCPGAAQQNLAAWATRHRKPTVALDQIKPRDGLVACAGTPSPAIAAEKRFADAAFSRRALSAHTGVIRFQRDRLAFTLPCLSAESGQLFADMLQAGKPITAAQADQLRRAVVKASGFQPRPFQAPEGMGLFVGDVHTHSHFSDGSPSPAGLAAEAFYAQLDFCVVSDHHYHRNGAAPLEKLLDASVFRYAVIPGMEITATWGHMNVYPLRDNSPSFAQHPFASFAEGLEFAKQQGGVAQWSHPADWIYTTMDYLSTQDGVEAWESYPQRFVQWGKTGKLPPLTGGTDTHFGTFSHPVRTVILAPGPEGADLAAAIRRRDCALLDPYDGAANEFYWEFHHLPRANAGDQVFVYGDARMEQLVVDALAEGKALKESKKRLIREALANFKPEVWLGWPEMR